MRRVLLSSVPGWVLGGASADIDFTHGRAWASGATSLASLLSTSRASSGMAQWADGHWSSFAANTPRITDQGLLSELARTNLFLNSAAPVTQTITLSTTGSYTLSCWGTSGSATVAAGTATGTGFGTANAAVKGAQVTFNITATGTITVTIAGSPLYVQVEAGSFGTSPIITGGTSATRATDIITLQGAALTAALKAKAGRVVSNALNYANGTSLMVYWAATGAYFYWEGPASIQIYAGSGTPGAVATGSGNPQGLQKSAFGFDASGITALANGGTKGTSSTAWPAQSGAVYLGNSNGPNSIGGYLVRVTFGPVKGMFDNLTTTPGLL